MACVSCGQKFVWMPADKAEFKGHVYSEAGRAETRISGLCEFCFDEITTDYVELEALAHGDIELPEQG